MRVDGAVGPPVSRATSGSAENDDKSTSSGSKEAVYVDWEDKKTPVKKWLGIW